MKVLLALGLLTLVAPLPRPDGVDECCVKAHEALPRDACPTGCPGTVTAPCTGQVNGIPTDGKCYQEPGTCSGPDAGLTIKIKPHYWYCVDATCPDGTATCRWSQGHVVIGSTSVKVKECNGTICVNH